MSAPRRGRYLDRGDERECPQRGLSPWRWRLALVLLVSCAAISSLAYASASDRSWVPALSDGVDLDDVVDFLVDAAVDRSPFEAVDPGGPAPLPRPGGAAPIGPSPSGRFSRPRAPPA